MKMTVTTLLFEQIQEQNNEQIPVGESIPLPFGELFSFLIFCHITGRMEPLVDPLGIEVANKVAKKTIRSAQDKPLED